MNLGRNATKKELALFAGLVLALLSVVPKIAYKPFQKVIQDTTTHISNMNMEKQALENFSAATPTLEKTETLHAKGVKMKVLLGEINSDYQEVTSLLNALTDRSFLGNIAIQKLGYQSPNYGEGYSKTAFGMQINGLFPEIVQYIDRLEQFPALFNIDEIYLKSSDKKTEQDEIEMTLEGNIYRFEKNPNKPANDPKGTQPTADSGGGGKT
ncbi:MAG: type 4a pilus biogenesis protein PilO [Deltaproteobacteria bacterium]|nr:MAG: type 4a pilus biogenesis protein PilO [Deltaproteobacteria bacterium]